MPTNRLRMPRPDPMLSRMVRAAHPVFTRMVRSRVYRPKQHLRMVPFREEPIETGSVVFVVSHINKKATIT